MTAAELKFADMEAALSRARCLARLLRHATDCGHDAVDPQMWGGVYITVCDIVKALDGASMTWTEAQEMAAGRR